MACIFLRSFVSGSHLFELLPEEYRVAYFREMSPGMVSVFSTLLGSTAVTRLFSKNFTLSYVKGGFSDPEVDPRPSDCKLWSLRSCSPSFVVDISVMAHRQIPMVVEILSSCSTLIRCSTFVVQVQQVRVLAARTQSSSHSYKPFLGPGRSHARCVQRQVLMVDVLMQFFDVGRRRCDAAATSSSCRPQQLE